MSPITTHILNTSLGKPASGVDIWLEIEKSTGVFTQIGQGTTDNDGRVKTLLKSDHHLAVGNYRLRFATGSYFQSLGTSCFYPTVEICFRIESPSEHYHVPLLLNPFGYSTYRGS